VAQGNADATDGYSAGYIFYSSTYGSTWVKKYSVLRIFTSIGISSDGNKIVATCSASSASFYATFTKDSDVMIVNSFYYGNGTICTGMITTSLPSGMFGFFIITAQNDGTQGSTGHYTISPPPIDNASGQTDASISAGFLYCTDAVSNSSPIFTSVKTYGVGDPNPINDPRNVRLYSDGTRFVITDFSGEGATVLAYDFSLSPTLKLSKVDDQLRSFNNDTVVSNLNSAGFTVIYSNYNTPNYIYYALVFPWSVSTNDPGPPSSVEIYSFLSQITSLQIITSGDGIVQLYLPTYNLSVPNDGCYLSLDMGTTWTKRENSANGIITSSTNNIAFILMEPTTYNIYAITRQSGPPLTIKIYKSVFGSANLFYQPYTPTTPTDWPLAHQPTTVAGALDIIAQFLNINFASYTATGWQNWT
jgi:hypothetical protein